MIADLDCLGPTIFHNRLERTRGNPEEENIYELMHAEREGYAYNELVVHLPMHALVNPERVLVMGGGTLFSTREILRHPSIRAVDVVDYDPDITEITIQHYDPTIQGVRDDPRVTIHNEDIRSFLQGQPPETFDAVVDDMIDIVRVEDRWVLELFPSIARVLKREGLFSTYLYSSWYHTDLNYAIVDKLRSAGLDRVMATAEDVFHYSWPEGYSSYICAAKKWPLSLEGTNEACAQAYLERRTRTRQYHPKIHGFERWIGKDDALQGKVQV